MGSSNSKVPEARAATELSGQELLKVTKNVREVLAGVLKLAEAHNTGVGWSKIGGGALAVIGGAALIAAPFTGGGSLAVAGAVAAGAGTVTCLSAGIAEVVKDKKFNQEIQDQRDQYQKALNDFSEKLAETMVIVMAEKGETIELKVTIQGLKTASTVAGIGGHLFGSATSISPLVAHSGVGVVNIAPAGVTVTEAATGSVVLQTGKSVTRTATTTAGKVFKVAGGGLNVVLGLIDVYQGVNQLAGGHSTEKEINATIKKTFEVDAIVTKELKALANLK